MWIFTAWAACFLFVHIWCGYDRARTTIFHDDHQFVVPLRDMTFAKYFTEWLPDRANYAFPVLNGTYVFDFWFERTFGFQSFWYVNAFIAVILAWILFQVLLEVFPQRQWISLAAVLVTFSHPVVTEIVQWAFLRKTLLALLFGYAGVLLVLRIQNGKLWLGIGLVVALFFCWALSLGSWPTAFLFGLYAANSLKDEIGKRWAWWLGAAGVLTYIYWRGISTGANDYSSGVAGILDGGILPRAMYFFIAALGRGFLNVFWPESLVIYYDHSRLYTWVGLAMLIAFIYFIGREPKSSPVRRGLFIGSVFFFPQLFILFTFGDFVWADRYALAILPWIVAPILIFVFDRLQHFVRDEKKARVLASSVVAVFVLGGLFLSAKEIPPWFSKEKLLDECVKKEGSPKCYILATERAYDNGGCLQAFTYIEKAKSERGFTSPRLFEGQYNIETPFYESICSIDAYNMSATQKLEEIEEIHRRFPNSFTYGMAKAYVLSQDRKYNEAFGAAALGYLESESIKAEFTNKLVNVARGQILGLCERSPGPECQWVSERFAAKYRLVPLQSEVIRVGKSKVP